MPHQDHDLIKWDEIPGVEKYPAIKEVGKNLVLGIENTAGGHQTSFMDELMVVGDRPTDIGKLRCLLEQVDSIRRALFDNLYKKKEYELKLNDLEANLKVPECALEFEKITNEFKINEVMFRKCLKRYNNYCALYKRIADRAGIKVLTDKMVEKNQAQEQLKTCFMQALRAAAARDSLPTEGDQMFADQVRISVSELNIEIREFAYKEDGTMRLFPHSEQVEWLETMWQKYKGRFK